MGAPEDTDSALESPSSRPAAGGQQAGPPSWWDPPPSIHVDQRYEQQVKPSPHSAHFGKQEAEPTAGT